MGQPWTEREEAGTWSTSTLSSSCEGCSPHSNRTMNRQNLPERALGTEKFREGGCIHAVILIPIWALESNPFLNLFSMVAGLHGWRTVMYPLMRILKAPKTFLTLTGIDMELQGRMLHRRVSLISLHRALSLVTREETPIPQLREHWDQEVVWTTHWSPTCLQARRD